MGTRGGETRDMGNKGLTVLPPPSNGEGGVGALEASRDTETGQDRSRELGRPWRIRGFGTPWRCRALGRPWRIRGLRRPWRIGGLRRPWRDRLRDRGPSPRLGLFDRSPTTPPKIPWGK